MAKVKIPIEQMQHIVSAFEIEGQVCESMPYGSGHINDTHAVTVNQGNTRRRYILQQINHTVFKNVSALMDNVVRVTQHIRTQLERVPGSNPDRETLTVVPTRNGDAFLTTAEGVYWRVYYFIEGALTYDVPRSNQQIMEAARAFGRFQALLADLIEPPLNETIPEFHHTPRRFEHLESAVGADVAGRNASCGAEIEFALSQKAIASCVIDGLASGALPPRVTHNDTKINNVMLDNTTGAGICVIDLDTVMPGSLLYDFGDQVRSTVGDFHENEKELGRVFAKMDRFEALVAGYADTAGATMVPAEIELLPQAGALITYEIGLRFLTDFLQGDVYFNTSHETENLDRARTQFALVRSLQEQESEMREIVGRAVFAAATSRR
ncbi:MAG: aminoglycoside phosphotransferase family protein [Lentisphaerae bacterium]|nr:aminoglycoside phosphotransferase family protein [Lentisphaerota bacterium]